jgi:hypothetical protein
MERFVTYSLRISVILFASLSYIVYVYDMHIYVCVCVCVCVYFNTCVFHW